MEEHFGLEGMHIVDPIDANDVLDALGGPINIVNLDACMTRLRVVVNRPEIIDKAALKKLGAAGIFEDKTWFQAVFGLQSTLLKGQIQEIIATGISKKSGSTIDYNATKDVVGQSSWYSIYAPLSGKILDLGEVPDPIFAQKLMGDGFAIMPVDGLVLSPIKGKVRQTFPTRHAIVLEGDSLEILIHVGIDTIKLGGEGFELLVNEGDSVAICAPLLKVDLAYVRERVPSIITPVVFMKLKGRKLAVNKTMAVAGQTIVCKVGNSI